MRRDGILEVVVLVTAVTWGSPALGQNHAPNPYRVAEPSFGQLPNGRKYGATSAIYPDRIRVAGTSASGATSTPCFSSTLPAGSLRARGGCVRRASRYDQDHSATSDAEGVAVDAKGNLCAAEVGPPTVKKDVKK